MNKNPIKTYSQFKEEKELEGLYTNVSDTEYSSAQGVRRSSLNSILRSPKYYKYSQENPMKATEALTFGTAFHTALLEPERWNKSCVVGPSVGKRTKKWDEFKDGNRDKIILHPDDYDLLNYMLESVHSNDFAMFYLRDRLKEVSAWCDINGHKAKARADSVIPERGILVDVKTTQDATFREFQRSSYIYKYHIQSAYYLDVFNKASKGSIHFNKFIFIAVEKKPPYDVQLYVADPDFVNKGREEYTYALDLLIECKEKNEWPGYPEQILNLSLPRWA